MTTIIAIETATEACSATLLIEKDDKQLNYTRFQLAPREHTKLILPMLDEVLAEADVQLAAVDAIAFGRGPGAFTGLRIATGIAQGLALSVDKPTIPISSLKAMALAGQKENSSVEYIVVAIDARMGEVYWAEYEVVDESLKQIGEEQLSKSDVMFEKTRLIIKENKTALIGSGWDSYLEESKNSDVDITSVEYFAEKFPDAMEISELALQAFKLGDYKSIEEAQPVYLRNNVAEKSKK